MREIGPSGFGEFDEQALSAGEQPTVSDGPEFVFGDGDPETLDASDENGIAGHPSMRDIEDTCDGCMMSPNVSGADGLGLSAEPVVANAADLSEGLRPDDPEESGGTGGESNAERNRDMLSKALVNPASCARFVVGMEDTRVDELFREHGSSTDAGKSRLAVFGRSLLERTGLRDPRPLREVVDAYAESRQEMHKEMITEELDRSRDLVRAGIIEGVDDVAVDTHIGLRTDDCMLPPLFQELHRRAETETGGEMTFLKWMTDHATDDQLLNVWQWHDHYLTSLDNDPEFQENVASAKAGYIERSGRAIEAGLLHPDSSVQEPEMGAIDVIHGSPFSPILAMAYAYADKATNVVQVREGVNDYSLYHEMTHILVGGMDPEFDEGITDLVAAAVYNQSRPEQEWVDPRGFAYANQIATLDAINRMSGGKMSLLELSRAYAGSDRYQNTLQFIAQVDEVVGLPIALPILKSAREIYKNNIAVRGGGTVRSDVQLSMRLQAEFLADMMLDDQGNKVAGTVSELLDRIISQDTIDRYGTGMAAVGLGMLLEINELMQLMSHIGLPEPGAENA